MTELQFYLWAMAKSSYEDFANYNEQALNLLTAKFAPVPNLIYPPLAKFWHLFDRHEWDHQ